MDDVAHQQHMSSLTRTLRVGDVMSLDNGRVIVTVDGVDRKRATVNFRIDREVKVDKPPKPG